MALSGLTPGDTLLRREVHERFGGRRQGGIAPSSQTPVVMFFSDPLTGHRHGYYDGWDDDKLFNYVGEGQSGDQRMVQGNKTILNHVKDGRSLEGFKASGTSVTYLGEFTLDDWYQTDGHATGDENEMRQVIVFRLRPVAFNAIPVDLLQTPFTRNPNRDRVDSVPVEESNTERAFVTPDREPYEMERREASLVRRYREHLRLSGHAVSRLRIVPRGETAPLFSDLWDETDRDLIEAKASVSREHIRSAVGQLLDYGRFTEWSSRTLLVPERPRPDLLSYLEAVDVQVVYPEGDDWVRIASSE